MDQTLEEISEKVRPLFEQYGIRRAKVFGSRARGDFRSDSDLDILIDYGDHEFSLLDHVGLQQDIRDMLSLDVDVVTESSVHPLLKERVQADARVIYEA